MNVTEFVKRLRAELKARADSKKAVAQQAYMKSALPYFGVAVPESRRVFREVMKDLEFDSFAQLNRFVRQVWQGAGHREEWYAAIALLDLKQTRAFQTLDALPLYEFLIVDGAWWDVVDDLATHRIAGLLEKWPTELGKTLRAWSKGEQLWLRRSAIIAQVLRHEETDLGLLFDVIEPALHEKEFFLRKAIGWGLRAAGKEHRAAVRKYVDANATRLSGLSRREAEKSLR
ncbi:MAG: DNA alkylation repair protein [Myxococcaceae bacterium]